MADRRPADEEMSRSKRVKTESNMDPSANPYLAHHYNGNGEDSSGNGHFNRRANGYSFNTSSAFAKFRRHKTTAEQAHEAEDGPNNPFNGAPLSERYFSILRTRRDLPVHKQRLVFSKLGLV